MDRAVTGAGVVHLECYADESLTQRFASIRKKLEGSGRFRIAWNGARDGRKAPAGRYWMRAYLDGREEEAFVFRWRSATGANQYQSGPHRSGRPG